MIAAWVFALLVLGTAAAGHIFAMSRASGDAGPFWAQVLGRLCLFVGLPLLLLSSFHTYPAVGDRLPQSPGLWFLILGVAWLVLLFLGSAWPADAGSGRWIAGILQFSRHRFWVLLFAIPFLPALFDLAPNWVDNIHAAHWGMLCLFIAALGGLAFSTAPQHVWRGPARNAEGFGVVLSPWPDEMRSRGVALRPIADWEPSALPEPVTGAALEWQQRLAAAGSPGVSGILCQAVSKLMTASGGGEDRVSIVLGPDQCGQEEVIALAATELARRFGETTLIVTAWPDHELAKRLRLFLGQIGGEAPAQLADLGDDTSLAPQIQPDVLLADAETLSDTVLDRLRSELEIAQSPGARGLGLARIGLVVWWNAHDFSGVDAAHVWAVSRRLERLLGTRRAAPARSAVFARLPRDREAAFYGFLEHLLPYEQTERNRYKIVPEFARRTHLYILEDGSPAALRKAVEASVHSDWKTYAHLSVNNGSAALPLAPSAPYAGACLLEVRPDEVLSLREIVCQGGRANDAGGEHHVAVAPSDNPYINYLLSHYRERGEDGASVNLIGAEGHAELVQRHLLLGLREVPDTLTGLRGNFRWKESTLRKALDRLSGEERLGRTPVRFLDDEHHLQRDSMYTNKNPGQAAVRTFRVIGRSNQRPVELRYRDVRDLLILQLDPERVALEAYPQKVLQSGSAFYRVQDSPAAAPGSRNSAPSRIDCRREEDGVRTWPYSAMRVANVRPNTNRLTFRGLVRYTAAVHYSEDIRRVLERSPDGAFKPLGIPHVRTDFETEALIMQFTQPLTDYKLQSAAAALCNAFFQCMRQLRRIRCEWSHFRNRGARDWHWWISTREASAW